MIEMEAYEIGEGDVYYIESYLMWHDEETVTMSIKVKSGYLSPQKQLFYEVIK